MPITEFCTTNVAIANKSATVSEIAKLMRERHVGDVVICDRDNGKFRPIGILTDRDMVVGLLAMDIPPTSVTAEDLMTPTLITVPEEIGVYETIQLMERYGVRRVPVVDRDGLLIGIVSSADLLQLLSTEIVSLARLSERQRRREMEIRL